MNLESDYELNAETVENENETVVMSFNFTKSPEELKKEAEERIDKERKTILKREKNFNEGVNLHGNLQNIDIKLIKDTPKGWNPFNPPTDVEILDLMRSLENVGLIYPLYVTKDKLGVYTLICGRCRLQAFANLFNITHSSKYESIPCYVLDTEEVDEIFLRTLIIESNIDFRTISKFNLVQSLIVNYDLMKKAKQFRNENNIGMELAKTFNMSESSVFNFIRVKSLCDEALELLFEKKITLKAAIYLSRVSKETQANILKRVGADGVNVIFRLKLLTSRDYKSIEKLEERIELVKNVIPPKTKITIEMQRELVNPLLKALTAFKGNEAIAFTHNGKFTYIFDVRYDKEAMGYYIDNNIVDKDILRKINAKTTAEFRK